MSQRSAKRSRALLSVRERGRAIDRPQIGPRRRGARARHIPEAVRHLVDNTELDLGFGKDRLDRLRQPFEAIDACDKTVLHPSIFQLVKTENQNFAPSLSLSHNPRSSFSPSMVMPNARYTAFRLHGPSGRDSQTRHRSTGSDTRRRGAATARFRTSSKTASVMVQLASVTPRRHRALPDGLECRASRGDAPTGLRLCHQALQASLAFGHQLWATLPLRSRGTTEVQRPVSVCTVF